MSLFRPVNSSESNLYTIRVSIGKGSLKGVFDTNDNTINDKVIVSNNVDNAVEVDHLSSPAMNNLPKGFFIKYDGVNKIFKITYGKKFTNHPIVNVMPHFSLNSFVTCTCEKNSLDGDDNLSLFFVNTNGVIVEPSTNGTTGFLGFDLEITGPTVIGITTGNSNKGWALSDSSSSDPTSVYSYLDVNLGSGFSINNSIVISKQLKLLNKDNNVTSFTSTQVLVKSNYTSSIWSLADNIVLNDLTPSTGLLLIIFRTGTGTSPVINLKTGCMINGNTTLTKLTFTSNSTTGSNIILFGTSSLNFITLANNNVTITSP